MPSGSERDTFTSLARRTLKSAAAVPKVVNEVDVLERTPTGEELKDHTRFVLAGCIGALYMFAVGFVLWKLAEHVPPLPKPRADGTLAISAALDPYSTALVDVLKAVVLPVVTFMLGYYFGTGQVLPGVAARSRKPPAKPSRTNKVSAPDAPTG